MGENNGLHYKQSPLAESVRTMQGGPARYVRFLRPVFDSGTAPQEGRLGKIRPVGQWQNFDTPRCNHRSPPQVIASFGKHTYRAGPPKTLENRRKLMDSYLGSEA